MSDDDRRAPDPDAPDPEDLAGDIVEVLLDGFDVDGDIETATDGEDVVRVRVVGEGNDSLIGENGRTINAIQYLVAHTLTRRTGHHRTVVDIGDYRERREEALKGLAARAAAEAVEHEEEIELDPMNPAERRIVHMELKEIGGVESRSEGEEPHRRIVVVPGDDA